MESAADNAVTGTLTAIDGGFAYRSEPSQYAVSWDCTLLGQPGSEGTLTCASRDGMAATFVYSGPITSIDSGRKFRFDGRMTGPESVPQTLADRPMVLRPG